LLHELIEGVVLVVHSKQPPTDEEWDATLVHIPKTHGGRPWLPVLVRAESGPNAMQRARLNIAIKHVRARTAVLHESTMARGVLMALQWIGLQEIQGFHPGDVDGALDYLGIDRAHRPAIRARLASMERELGLIAERAAREGTRG
jgi:hypothetical protein